VIVRLDVHGRRIGVFDSGVATEGAADPPLLQARVWLEPMRFYSESAAAFTFTYVNGNPFGTAVGETEDYHGSCWQTFVDFRAKRFPDLKENPGDNWMPSELPDLPVRRIADVELEVVGPEPGAWPPVGFQRTYAEALKLQDLRGLLSGLMPVAWRRPVTVEEVAGIEAFAAKAADPSGGFSAKVQAAITRILVAPEFLFLVEAVPPGMPRGSYRLTNWELATRLSYFLTGTQPDAELRDAAGRGVRRHHASTLHALPEMHDESLHQTLLSAEHADHGLARRARAATSGRLLHDTQVSRIESAPGAACGSGHGGMIA
jgi:hypothetical protein